MHDLTQRMLDIKAKTGSVCMILPMQRIRPLAEFGGAFINVGVTSSFDKVELVKCSLTEERYKLDRNYKVEFVSDDPEYPARESFYISDLDSLMRGSPNKYILLEAPVVKEDDRWKIQAYDVLSTILVGETGLSAITEATYLRKLHPIGSLREGQPVSDTVKQEDMKKYISNILVGRGEDPLTDQEFTHATERGCTHEEMILSHVRGLRSQYSS